MTGIAITTPMLSVAIFVIHLDGPERLIPWPIGSSNRGAPPTPPATGFPFGPDDPFGPNGPFRPGGPLGPGGPFAPKVRSWPPGASTGDSHFVGGPIADLAAPIGQTIPAAPLELSEKHHALDSSPLVADP